MAKPLFFVKEYQKCCTSLRDLIQDALLRDRKRRKRPITRQESNPRPEEFCSVGMCSTAVQQPPHRKWRWKGRANRGKVEFPRLQLFLETTALTQNISSPTSSFSVQLIRSTLCEEKDDLEDLREPQMLANPVLSHTLWWQAAHHRGSSGAYRPAPLGSYLNVPPKILSHLRAECLWKQRKENSTKTKSR